MIIVVMGVTGSGKTTVGKKLTAALHCAFLEGDGLHSQANVEKMSHGIPLTDADRAPWLGATHKRMCAAFTAGQSLVVACSALKRSYRARLAEGLPVTWVYLKGSADLIRSRLQHRAHHFMKANMLASQFDVLEEPSDAIIVDIAQPPDAIVEQILAGVSGPTTSGASTPPRQPLMMPPDIRVFGDVNALSAAAAEALVATLNHAVRANGRGSLVLSGGNTPRTVYQLLASAWRDHIPWGAVHLFWGDERYVPHADPHSNYRLAKETLLDHVPCPPANIHPMPTDLADPDAAARAYDVTLHRYFGDGPAQFDLVLLGLGEEGHTASLFPRSPALAERTRWTVAVTAPVNPPRRLTLTMPTLVHAAAIYFLVAGSSKANALSEVLKATADPILYPAAGVRSDASTVTWWVDKEAAGEYWTAGHASGAIRSKGGRR